MVNFRLKIAVSSLFILRAGCFVFFIFSALNSLAQTNSIGAALPKVELVLGNPSSATADTSSDPNNFLLVHNGFVFPTIESAANWATWHLSKTDIGDVDRTNAFAPDTALSKDWWIRPSDYVGSGYDRGHLSRRKTAATRKLITGKLFLMSNYATPPYF